MSVFRRGVRVARGAAVDELPSDDSDSDSEDDSTMSAREEESDEDGQGPVNLGWKFEPDQHAESSSRDEEDDGDEGDEGAPQFPITCAICTGKTLFRMKDVNDHMASKRHKKKEAEYELAQRKAKRTSEQIDKLKARNARKKQRKMEKKKSERTHVWGQHKEPVSDKPKPKPKPKGSKRIATGQK